MKKFDWRNIRLRKVSIEDLNDRLLLINLYATQAITLVIGLIIVYLQKNNDLHLFDLSAGWIIVVWGGLFAGLVLLADVFAGRWVPEEVTDDGGINQMLFENRPLWHIAVISLIVAVCEEILFRGAVQHAIGPYWTSIVFAAVHVRYLKHWIMTGLVFSISYGLGWIYIRTGTLLTPILAHFIIDFVMGSIIRFRRES
ncbi:CPBP family intramembrane glutamic endopeptidase [Ferviditalea candida]|uniref:CPBP family intramembrane glutamic endopeptidase n=1 Tax=Ferviditalea candida TaxID=3108399 RepID=A0ABU5ZJU7_9BACL|nr:CPBP family intramembrane glutamic endopeptidase [Paenibacillaceae bacterium T2]